MAQLPGVGLVSISGGQRPAVRIQANPTALASYGLSLEDLRTALSAANVDQAKGTFDGAHQAYTIGANDQLITSESYGPLIVAYRNGAPVRLSDVANVFEGTENVNRRPGSNTDARSNFEYSASAGRQHHLRRGSGQKAAAPACRLRSPLPSKSTF